MLNTNIDWYENISRENALEWYDWGADVMAGSPILVSDTADNKVFIAKINEGEWCCEIEGWEEYDGLNWNMLGQGFGETAEEALAAAIVECVGYDVLREEDNCEDASNVIARQAYVFAYGDTPYCMMDIANVNWLMGAACNFVKANGKQFGIEWEEFREAI